ncbi:hypothetical protein ACIQ9P_26995 [Kitasatospora sp. NPDC094019]
MPYLTERINRLGKYPAHELGITPDTYDVPPYVDLSPLGDDEKATEA